MLTVGENTFATIAEANTYLRLQRGSAPWYNLSENERGVLLATAYRKMNTILLKNSPDDVLRQAQILEAFEMTKEDRLADEARQARGVTSVSLGKASETYSAAYSAGRADSAGVPLLSAMAWALLKPYRTRSAPII